MTLLLLTDESRVVEPYSMEMNVLASKSHEQGTNEHQSLSPEAAQIHEIGQVEAPYLM